MGLMEQDMPPAIGGRALDAPRERMWAGVVTPEGAVLGASATAVTTEDKTGWIQTGVTDAEAARMLRGADSCVRPLLDRHGYRIAKRALQENRSVYDLVLEEGLLTKAELDDLLRPELMIKPKKFYHKK